MLSWNLTNKTSYSSTVEVLLSERGADFIVSCLIELVLSLKPLKFVNCSKGIKYSKITNGLNPSFE